MLGYTDAESASCHDRPEPNDYTAASLNLNIKSFRSISHSLPHAQTNNPYLLTFLSVVPWSSIMDLADPIIDGLSSLDEVAGLVSLVKMLLLYSRSLSLLTPVYCAGGNKHASLIISHAL